VLHFLYNFIRIKSAGEGSRPRASQGAHDPADNLSLVSPHGMPCTRAKRVVHGATSSPSWGRYQTRLLTSSLYE
jgi:hypothetical protein